MAAIRSLSVITSVVLLGACAIEHEATDPDPVTLDELGAALADAYCSKIEECYASFESIPGEVLFPETYDCRAGQQASFEDGMLPIYREAIARGTVTYDAVAVGACLRELASSPCMELASMADLCADGIRGNVPEGGLCSDSLECGRGLHCDQTIECPGTCALDGAAGADCVSDGDCLPGLVCGFDACVVPAMRGASCETVPCARDLLCLALDPEAAPSCLGLEEVFVGELGESCDMGFCRPGLYCAAMGGGGSTCVPPAASSGACTFSFPDMCPGREACDSSTGTCRQLPTEGEPCSDSCVDGLLCRDGACARLGRVGDPCVDDFDCAGWSCEAGGCVAPSLCPWS